MKIVILHYHLNPGGVTRIIESQIKGIQSASETVELEMLCGSDENDANLSGIKKYVNELLNYRDIKSRKRKFGAEVDHLISWIKNHLTGNAVLHCHNPNLGKNPVLTLAVYRLAAEGYAVVNHCHDFPEERPANIEILKNLIPELSGLPLSQVLYPTFSRYRYITLNSCDHQGLLEKGVPGSRIHLVPNPVTLGSRITIGLKPALRNRICETLGFKQNRKICTYPVRAIKRKNIGEFILLAAMFTEEASFTITLAPKNPMELTEYNKWKDFCHKYEISVKFESGGSVNHEELINISDFCITTSMQEGFGMVYLEPWLAGTPVIGRDLPCITADLKMRGIEFQRLYPHILVRVREELVDFKNLKTADQRKMITDICCRKSVRLRLFQDNPFLLTFLDDFPQDLVNKNQEIIKSAFSTEKYGEKLLAIYSEISQ